MFSANDEPEGKFLYTETIKLYYTVLFLEGGRFLCKELILIIAEDSLCITTQRILQFSVAFVFLLVSVGFDTAQLSKVC